MTESYLTAPYIDNNTDEKYYWQLYNTLNISTNYCKQKNNSKLSD